MTTDTVGGIWTYSLTLARELGNYGIRVYLATMGAPLSTSQRNEAAAIDNLELFESEYRLEWMDDPWEDVGKAGAWLRMIARRVSPDIVHLNGYSHAALPWPCPVLIVAHSCVLSWWRAVKGENAPADWDCYRMKVAAGLATADAVASPSRAMLQALRFCYGVHFEGTVVPNSTDPALFTPGNKQALIFAAGRLWDEAKNIPVLDRIAAQLSWPVYIAGEQQHPSGGQRALAGGRALGRLAPEEARQWYTRASIYALPAKYEPFGLSVLEAALSGCALVLGDIPSLRENWDGAAIFVDPDDAALLRSSIEMLIADDELRNRLGERARRRGMHFVPQRMCDGYLSLYRELAGTRQLNPCA